MSGMKPLQQNHLEVTTMYNNGMCGNGCMWIIILLVLFCCCGNGFGGNGFGCGNGGGNNGCGCGCDNNCCC